jgi:rSAM/selenodomain-associated transferase 2
MRSSVIIPTWCEEAQVEGAVRSARRVGDEVIVADAASPDGTARVARAAGARVVRCPRNRGAQLARGVAEARGDVLVFLHADARLSPRARPAIAEALRDPEVCGGSFRLTFVPSGGWARFFTRGHDVHRRWTGIVYGDSGIFVRRTAYEAVGGVRPLPLMEDYDLVRRLRRVGRFTYVRHVEVRASDRRFVREPVRTALGWVALECLYLAGVPPAALARLYADVR